LPDSVPSNPSSYPSNQDQSARAYSSAYGRFSLRNRSTQLLVATALLLAIAFGSGYYLHSTQVKDNISPKNLQTLLPLPLEILTNSIVYDWQGSVEGDVTDKNDQNSTLSIKKKNAVITVKIVKNLTSFTDVTSTTPKVISFSDLKLNDFVRMTVWFPVKGAVPASGTEGDIVARYVTVSKK
jgi:hypothetical protein